MENPVNTPGTPAPGKPRSRWRLLLYIAGGLFGLLLVLYFVLTSSSFLKSVVLPKVGAALKMRVTADSVSLSPFSQLTVSGLKVETPGAEPALRADLVRIRYRLWPILSGNINAQEITLESPTLTLVQHPDGTSNMDPLMQMLTAETPPKPQKAPLQLALQNLKLSQGKIIWNQTAKNGDKQSAELSGINLSIDQVQNGQSGNITLSTELKYEKSQSTNAVKHLLVAKVAGGYKLKLENNLMPQSVSGALKLDIGQAQGAWQDLANLAAALECELTPAAVDKLVLRFERQGAPLGMITASGPFDRNKLEGQLKLEISGIDRQVLNFFGAPAGFDFSKTVLGATNWVDLTRQGKGIAARGQLAASQFSLIQQGQTTPTVDISLDYQVTVDLTGQKALVEKFQLRGLQNTRPLLQAGINQPMPISWAKALQGLKDSALNSALELNVTNLNLAEWRAVLGNTVPSGLISAGAKLLSQQDGRKINADLFVGAQDLVAKMSTNTLTFDRISVRAKAAVDDYNLVNLESYALETSAGMQPLVNLSGSGQLNLEKKDYNLRMAMESWLPSLIKLYPYPGVAITSGTLKYAGQIHQQPAGQKINGVISLNGFTGRYGNLPLANYQVGAECDVQLAQTAGQLRIQQADIKFINDGRASLSGNLNLSNLASQLTFKLENLSQNLLSPLAGIFLAPKTLATINLNANGALDFDPQKESKLQLNLGIGNLVVMDPKTAQPPAPLSAQMQFEGGLKGAVAEIRQCLLDLPATPANKNQVQVTGRMDFSQPGVYSGQLVAQAETLDLTAIQQMLGKPAATSQTAPAKPGAPTPAPSTQPETEPAPVTLPFKNFGVDVKIGKLGLGEVLITNWLASLKFNGGEVAVNPLQLALNGTPIKAVGAFNLGVPGYTYDLNWQAGKISIEPLVNTFSPDNKGVYQGFISTDGQIKGAGITGANLQKNLAGQFNLTVTNANKALLSNRMRFFLVPVAFLLQIREMLDSPLDSVVINGQAGQGLIQIQQFKAFSPAFQAQSQGTITLAPVLTNSTLSFPVIVSLKRSVAEKANFIPTGTPPGTPFVNLPEFVNIIGTVGAPDTQINKLALLGVGIRTLGSIPKNIGNISADAIGEASQLVGNTASKMLETPVNLLNKIPGMQSATATNPAAQPANIVGGLFRNATESLLGKTPASPATNLPAVTTPPISPAVAKQTLTNALATNASQISGGQISTNPPVLTNINIQANPATNAPNSLLRQIAPGLFPTRK